MKITITIQLLSSNHKLDIQVDQAQRIKTTLRVLAENRSDFGSVNNVSEVRIKHSGRRVSTERTYEEASIYSGTELIIEKYNE